MENISSTRADAFVHIVGSNKLQNELLLSFLKEKTGCEGACVQNLKATVSLNEHVSPRIQFLLVDCHDNDIESLWSSITSLKMLNLNDCYFALCNVEPDMKIEETAVSLGIKGIFYKKDPLHSIPKGISEMLDGNLWYSRKVLSRFLMKKNISEPMKKESVETNLSEREKEVLGLIASGYSNHMVAEKLCISEHTVKTHTYNIYKKIGVSNRLQATLWAAKYL